MRRIKKSVILLSSVSCAGEAFFSCVLSVFFITELSKMLLLITTFLEWLLLWVLEGMASFKMALNELQNAGFWIHNSAANPKKIGAITSPASYICCVNTGK